MPQKPLKNPTPYNPIAELGYSYDEIARRIGDVLMQQTAERMDDLDRFTGAGIYAIYYTGEFQPFPTYARLARSHRDSPFRQPIYVGKSDPPGSRKGGLGGVSTHTKLMGRLNQHKNSLDQCENLDVRDFFARYLVLDTVWIPLAERSLIAQLKPLWVAYIDGFGNHYPGKERTTSVRSMWDTLHPGRRFTAIRTFRDNPLTIAQIEERIHAVLAGVPIRTLPEAAIV